MAKTDLTAQRLRELLSYDPETGVFTRLVYASSHATIGRAAGGLSSSGYIYIAIDGRKYQAHRLAWLYTHGCWPALEVDHINGVKFDNRISNLRDVSRTDNARNFLGPTKRNASSGVLGVTPCGDRWRAAVTVSRKRIHVGVFDTKEAAHDAYLKAKRVLHAGGCTL